MNRTLTLLSLSAVVIFVVGLFFIVSGQSQAKNIIPQLSAPQTIANNQLGGDPRYSAELVSQSPSVAVSYGQSSNLYVRFRNIGALPWVKGSQNPIRLGLTDPMVEESPLHSEFWAGRDRPANQTEDVVKPGDIGLFQFAVYGNQTPAGFYDQTFGLVAENITWLSGKSQVRWGIYVLPNFISGSLIHPINHPVLQSLNLKFALGKLFFLLGLILIAVLTIAYFLSRTKRTARAQGWPYSIGQIAGILAFYVLLSVAIIVFVTKEPGIWLGTVSPMSLSALVLVWISVLGFLIGERKKND